MALNSYVGSFNLDSSITAGNNQSVTGVGFEPKIVLFWWSGSTATGDSVAGGTISTGFGAAISSSSRFCVAGISEDGQAESDTYCYNSVGECIRIYTDTGTLDGLADFASLDANGFTLTIDNQFSSDYRISFLALGGTDLTNVYIGNKQRDNDTGNCAVTGVGFQPDAVIITSAFIVSPNGGLNGTQLCFGIATNSDDQGVVASMSQDGQATTNTRGYGYNGEILARAATWGAVCDVRDTFVSMDADGFTLNQLEGTTQFYYHYIALAGGQYATGDLTTRTDGNDIEENPGFEPAALLFFSANRALNTQDVATDHARISIGAASATDERAVQAWSDEDNLDDSETAYTNQDDAVYAHVIDDAIESLMDIKSFDSDGFTCVMDDTETNACWVTYLAIGAEGTGDYEISESESITLGESLTAQVSTPTVSESDGLTIGDDLTAELVVQVSTTDSITVADTPRYYIDNIAIGEHLTAEVVSPTPTPEIEEADGVTVGDNLTAALSDLVASESDNVTVSDNLTAELDDLRISEADGVTIGDIDDVELGAVGETNVSESDNVTLADNLSAALSDLLIGESDGLTIGDVLTTAIGNLAISEADGLTIGDVLAAKLGDLLVSESDGLTISDNLTAALSDLVISEADGLTVGDNLIAVLQAFIAESDGLTIGDDLTADLQQTISKSDNLTVGDSVAASPDDLIITESDNLAVGDVPNVIRQIEGVLYISEAENLTVGDNLTASLPDLEVSESDGITVGDVDAEILASTISVSDNITVGDTPRYYIDNVTVGEHLSVALVAGETAISESDNITVGDTVNATLDDLEIAESDSLTVGDIANVSTEVIGDLTASESDNVIIGDNLTVALDDHAISETDGITIGEAISVNLADLGIEASDSLTIGETVTLTMGDLTISTSDGLTIGEVVTVAMLVSIVESWTLLTRGLAWTVESRDIDWNVYDRADEWTVDERSLALDLFDRAVTWTLEDK